MVLPPLKVLKITIQLLDLYKGDASLDDLIKPQKNRCAPEDFLEEQFKKKSYSPIIQEKVSEIFFTISKYRQLFDEVLNDYQNTKSFPQTKKQTDTSLLLVILYLVITSLSNTTTGKISEILIIINVKKSLAFFNYLKKPSTINNLFKWACQIWELDYVKQVLASILDDDQLFQAVYDKLNEHLSEKKKNKSVKKLTVPVELNVLKHPRREINLKKHEPDEFTNKTTRRHRFPFFEVTPPLVFPSPPKPAEVPKTTYARPVHDKRLEDARLKNYEDAIRLYEEAQKKAFNCAGVVKSEKYKETIEKIEKERYAVPERKKLKPKLNNVDVPPPKKTAAVILREGARLMKVEKEEIKRYEELASGAFNDDALIIWEKEMREQKIRQDLEEIERKHLQGLISYEDALLAKQNYLRKTKEKADEFRKEKEAWQSQLEMWRDEEQKRIKECVAKERESEKGVKEAMELVKEEKHKKAIEAMQESKALREQWLRQKEEELQKKIQLIQEIKALQTLGVIKKKNADLSETANMGFLCEMSIAELRERLILLKMELKEEVEKRKDEIMKRRECRKEIVESYQGLIESHREIMRLKKETPRSCEKIKKTSPSVENLRRKLEEKRNERLKQK